MSVQIALPVAANVLVLASVERIVTPTKSTRPRVTTQGADTEMIYVYWVVEVVG